jgi:hypothetical protein
MAEEDLAPGGIELTSPVWEAWRPDEIAERLTGAWARVALPMLTPVRRTWLRRQIGRLHPGHDWLDLL